MLWQSLTRSRSLLFRSAACLRLSTITTSTPTLSSSTMSSSDSSSLLSDTTCVPRPIVISGPSGSGKSTLLNKLFNEFPGIFCFSISHTTRNPRPGETNGKEYHFVTREEFHQLVEEDGFLERAEFSGNCYGTSKKSVKDISESGRLCVLDVEVNGVKNIKKASLSPPPRYLFVKPPSLDELKKRLQGRGTETEESLQKRLDSCKEAFDYSDEPDAYDHIIHNNDLEVAYEHLKGILIADIHTLQGNKLKKGH